MPGLRNLVRVLVGSALCFGLAACAFLPVPKDLPAVALGQATLYRLEVALGVFYGCLLLATPAYSGLVRGRLPTEISTRGAKFAGEADQTVEQDEAAIKKIERVIAGFEVDLSNAQADIDILRRDSVDNT